MGCCNGRQQAFRYQGLPSAPTAVLSDLGYAERLELEIDYVLPVLDIPSSLQA